MSKPTHISINEKVIIPVSELVLKFSTSSGPGGQHVNRSATHVTLLFDVAQSLSLDESSRAKLQERLAQRIDKKGILHIEAQDSRSQRRNRETAISRFKRLLADALVKPKKRIKTKPSSAALKKRKNYNKKASQRKQDRRKDWSKDA